MKNMGLDNIENLEKKYLTAADNGKIYYEKYYTSNTKTVLVLVHGAGGDTAAWNLVRNLLFKAGYSTISMDLRGHGFSERRGKIEFYKIEHIIEDIKQIIKEEKLTQYVLVGHCYGANIAMKFASTNPPGLKAFVAINTSFKTGLTDLYTSMPKLRKAFVYFSEHLPKIGKPGQTDFVKYIGTGDLHVGRIIATISKVTLQSFFLTYDQALSLNNTNDVAKISCPVYIMGGVHDIFFPPRTLEALKQKIPNSKLDILPDSDHITLLNKPKELATGITDFLHSEGI